MREGAFVVGATLGDEGAEHGTAFIGGAGEVALAVEEGDLDVGSVLPIREGRWFGGDDGGVGSVFFATTADVAIWFGNGAGLEAVARVAEFEDVVSFFDEKVERASVDGEVGFASGVS